MLANMNVREAPDGGADPVTDVNKGDIVNVLEDRGEWFRLSLTVATGSRTDVWIKNRNSKKVLVEKCTDAAAAGAQWAKQEIIAAGGADPEAEVSELH